nr:Uncharacterised protein [Klebsiella pneumoniae]
MEAINLPLYQRIARQLKSAIERGELTPAAVCPPAGCTLRSRASPGRPSKTPGRAGRPGMARAAWAGGDLCQRAAQPAPAGAGTASATGRADGAAAVSDGAAGAGSLPRGQWARVMGRRLRTQSRFDLAPGDPGGDPLLRRYRRLSTPVAQYRLSAGSGVDHRQLCRLHESYPAYPAQPGQHMWMEDPGYPFIRPVVEAGQLAVDAIPVDDEGMDVGWGQRHHPQARFALLTPAHQSPLGSRCRFPDAASCWRGPRSATRGSLRTITIASFAITANRCRR